MQNAMFDLLIGSKLLQMLRITKSYQIKEAISCSAGVARGVRGADKPSVISTDRMRSSKSVSRGDV